MQVICINAMGDWSQLLKEGNIYSVISETDDDAYVFEEIQHPHLHPRRGFKKYRFIPLSSIDETEMVRNYQTQNA